MKENSRTANFPSSSKPTGRRLLAIFAHPDDETFGPGGTLALYARRGDEIHLICATRGEVGEAPPDLKGFASVGAMREDELRRAASVLGLKAVRFLGYRDSGMPGSPDNHHPQALAISGRFVRRSSSHSTRLAATATRTISLFTGQPWKPSVWQETPVRISMACHPISPKNCITLHFPAAFCAG